MTDLESLAHELRNVRDTEHRQAIHVLVDKYLDDKLKQAGAHDPACHCERCSAVVADALTKRLGELVDPRDVARDVGW